MNHNHREDIEDAIRTGIERQIGYIVRTHFTGHARRANIEGIAAELQGLTHEIAERLVRDFRIERRLRTRKVVNP